MAGVPVSVPRVREGARIETSFGDSALRASATARLQNVSTTWEDSGGLEGIEGDSKNWEKRR